MSDVTACASSVGSDDYYDYPCGLCVQEKKNVEASEFCIECKEYLCEGCVSTHKKFPMMKNHTLKKLSDVESLRKSGVLSTVVSKHECPKHSGEYLQTFCWDHIVVCCSVCVSVDHRMCDEVQYLPEAAQRFASREEFNDDVDEAKDAKDSLQSLINSEEENKTKVEQEITEAIQLVKYFHKNMADQLNLMEKKTLESLENRKQKIISDASNKVQKCKAGLAVVDAFLQRLSAGDGNEIQLLFQYSKAKEAIEEVDGMSSSDEETEELQFKLNPRLQALAEKLSSYEDFEDPKDNSHEGTAENESSDDDDNILGIPMDNLQL